MSPRRGGVAYDFLVNGELIYTNQSSENLEPSDVLKMRTSENEGFAMQTMSGTQFANRDSDCSVEYTDAFRRLNKIRSKNNV